ncbi:hypothetical protein LTR78_005131 [Recurvomyces mirabilis]|uniref:Uncharacterized protein n=1 Tax=Recurvomyces mirabilis TaxID=574656 RepID=A0AAE0WNY7_9PEZI|nr:hypothetical protein LTR78_005131 [Recurvomyces mirabilis]KAK5158255.1 hypothetical protein LTS14_003273 [Recurvomyces mirabilis]
MPSTATMSGPLTPAKQIARFSDAMGLRDSPFSDYFTDDARSIEHISGGAVYDMPSSQTQQMLVRLNKLQAQLMRAGEDGGDALNIVGRKLSEIENDMDALHSQTRVAPELDDSGLFMDDDDEPAATTPARASTAEGYFGGFNGTLEEAEDDVTPEEKAAERDYQLVEAQRVLDNVTKAQEELRKRHAELVQLNDDRAVQIEDYEHEVEELRSENESLRSELGLDHSELLFMKLQLKSLEVELDGESEEDQSSRRSRTLEEMDKWRSDWHDVDARLRKRRGRYGVVTEEDKRTSQRDRLNAGDSSDEDDEDSWYLETVTRCASRGRRVASITIRRMNRSNQPFGSDGAADDLSAHTVKDDSKSQVAKDAATQQKTAENQPDELRASQKQYSATSPHPAYTDQSTQTSHNNSTSTPTQHDIPRPPFNRPHLSNSSDDDDDTASECAVTTSSPTPLTQSPLIPPRKAVLTRLPNLPPLPLPLPTPAAKTAWRELWEGLNSFAGMAGAEDEGGEGRK